MDSAQQQALIQRLVSNPQDQAAIAEAHEAGQQNPESYAVLLEKVGYETADPLMASHWLNEAANVWITTFGNLHRAASVLMAAVERAPEADAPAQRLAQLYIEGGDHRAHAALGERRAGALAERAKSEPALRPLAARLYEELGQLWQSEQLRDVGQAKAAYLKAVELNPVSQYAIYSLRELYKGAAEYARAIPYFAMEQAIVEDAERKLALYLDEAEVCKLAGKPDAAIAALRRARSAVPTDPTFKQQLATAILEKYRSGASTIESERYEASQLFVALAEEFPGEHGFLYALCSLELIPGDDRACQLALHYGQSLDRLEELAPLAAGYVQAKPDGAFADAAREAAGDAQPPAAPERLALAEPDADDEGGPSLGPQISEDELADLLDEAVEFAKKGRKNQAIASYKKVLVGDPANGEAIGYLMQQLPPKRKYADLRDVLLTAAEVSAVDVEQRVAWLREAAGLCERQLRDFDSAVTAWKRIYELDREAEGALDQYTRLLDRARRWDELAELLEGQARETEDLEVRIALERNVAKLHSSKRKDLASAGEAWARIADLTPGDEAALMEAVRLFEKAEEHQRVADVIAAGVAELDDPDAQHELYEKLGRLRAGRDDLTGAADALAEGAERLSDPTMWASAEAYYGQAQAWGQAASAALAQKELAETTERKAAFSAQAAQYLFRAGEHEEALQCLEQSVELEPSKEEYANQLEQRLIAAGRVNEVAALFLGRAAKLSEPQTRMDLRRRAARLQREHMNDVDSARDSFVLVLQDGEDPETLAWLADDAEGNQDYPGAVEYLARLALVLDDKDEKLDVLHREAALLANEIEDIDSAIERFEQILSAVDPKNELALSQIADLEIARGNWDEAAHVLERHVKVAESREVKLEVSTRLADIYENRLSQPHDAMRVLKFIHSADPDDFDATQRLSDLARAAEDWELVANLMVELIAVEGDESEVSVLTRELAEILNGRLSKAGEALEALGKVADKGDGPCREDFIALGDELGEKTKVAERMVSWFLDAVPGPERDDALNGAFERFVESGADAQAAEVAKELHRSSSAEPTIAGPLEDIAIRLEDLEALAIAHRLKVTDLVGVERGEETVRQAEVLAKLEVPEADLIRHGEVGLTDVPPPDVEPLLARLAKLASTVEGSIDVYERQVVRCGSEEDRLNALCRAAEVANDADAHERASSFFDVALSGGVHEQAVERIIAVARSADEKNGDKALRAVLADSLAAGGQAARDGGRTRSTLLRRAALLVHEELDDDERAFRWLGEALICHVDDDALRALFQLAEAADDFKKAEAVLEHALNEVFDGPLVRRLLRCRASLREEHLDDKKGAAADLKRLLDLSPGDPDVMERLGQLYADVGDHRGIVQLYEDQILRGRDKERRAELARRIALLWQDELKDPREAADAWRRVLRLIPGDDEAKEGLATAKEQMLRTRRRSSFGADGSSPVPADGTSGSEETAGSEPNGPVPPLPPSFAPPDVVNSSSDALAAPSTAEQAPVDGQAGALSEHNAAAGLEDDAAVLAPLSLDPENADLTPQSDAAAAPSDAAAAHDDAAASALPLPGTGEDADDETELVDGGSDAEAPGSGREMLAGVTPDGATPVSPPLEDVERATLHDAPASLRPSDPAGVLPSAAERVAAEPDDGEPHGEESPTSETALPFESVPEPVMPGAEFDEGEFDQTRVDLDRGETLPDSVEPGPGSDEEIDVDVTDASSEVGMPVPPGPASTAGDPQSSVVPRPPGTSPRAAPPPRRPRAPGSGAAPPPPPRGASSTSRRPPPRPANVRKG